MTKKIFRSTLAVAAVALLATLILIMGVLYDYFTGQRTNQLEVEAKLAAVGVELEGLTYLERLEGTDLRLTWIDSYGDVVFDSHADEQTMENHAEREEFIEAVKSGYGESSRTSATLSEKTIYEARLLSDGSVIRVSASHYTILTLLLGILQPLLVVILLAVGLSAWLSSRISKRIVDPLNNINLDSPLENEAYDEISPLLTRVSRQQRQIASQLEQLRRRRDEFETVTRSMSEGLILLDTSMNILSINRSAADIFGAKGDCTGRDILTVDRSPELRALLESVATGQRGEVIVTRDGKEYQLSADPVNSNGERSGTVLLAFDVTEKLRSERMRREFTANVSHELKTPLQAIMGSAELLENGLVKPDDQAIFLTRIRTEAQQLMELIEDVIRLSRMDEGDRPESEDVDLLAISRQVAEGLTPAAKEKGISISITGEQASVRGVRSLIYEIVYNLCDNTIKYGRQNGHTTIDIQQRADAVELCVADDGVGIPADQQSRVFERFYRVDKSHSRNTGGTGLGLSIVKHAAQYHNATLSLTSEPGKGTSIRVVFPRA